MDPRKPSSADPEKLIETIQKYGVTSAFASPVIGHKILTLVLQKNSSIFHEANSFGGSTIATEFNFGTFENS